MLPFLPIRSLRILTLTVAGLLLVGIEPAFGADPLSEVLSRFDIAVTKSSRALFQGRGDHTLVPLLTQLRQEIEAARWKEAVALVHRIDYSNQTDEVLKIGSEAIEQIEAKAKAAEDAEVHVIEAAIVRVAGECLHATDPRQLDKLVEELGSLSAYRRVSEQDRSPAMFAAHRKLASALAYIQVWQDYLTLRSTGKEVEAAKKMEDLARRDDWYAAVPRSEVLARTIPPPPTPAPRQGNIDENLSSLFAKMKSLDDLDATIVDLQALAAKHRSSDKLRVTLEAMTRLQAARRALTAQDYAAAFRLCAEPLGQYVNVAEQLTPIRHQLLLEVLPQYLPKRELAPPLPQETVTNYLMRTAKSALEAQDWMLALSSLEALGTISFGQHFLPSWLSADVSALRSLIQGDRQNAAGEFARAAASYQAALEPTSENAPLNAIAERLRALRKSHPDAFNLPAPRPSRANIR